MKGHVIYPALAAIFLLLGTAGGLQHGERCQTPNRASGSCIRIRNCPYYVNALKAKPLPQSTVDILRRSQCGFQGNNPLICCPSTTPTVTSPTPQPAGPPTPLIGTEITEDISQHKNLGLFRSDICGPISESRIIYGNKTKLNEMPWMALIAYSVKKGFPFKCGGTIISDRYILTAGHCVKFLQSTLRPVSVRLGEHDLDSDIDCDDDPDIEPEDRVCAPAPQNIQIEEIIAHPKYTGIPNFLSDIALIRLSKPADFKSDSVRPICLPIGLQEQTNKLNGIKVVVTGWGITEDGAPSPLLLKAAVPVVPYEQCRNSYRITMTISSVSQLCAGGVKYGGDSCKGDSGGPLIYFGDVQGTTRTIQHGIVSYGPKDCGSTGQPVVYTRVGHFMKWILDTMKP